MCPHLDIFVQNKVIPMDSRSYMIRYILEAISQASAMRNVLNNSSNNIAFYLDVMWLLMGVI